MRLYIAQSLRQYFHYNEVESAIHQRVMAMISWQATTIQQLLQLSIPENNQATISQEINIQLRINRTVYVIWLSFLIDHKAVASVDNYIINPEFAEKSDIAKAYELLDSHSTNPNLRRSIALTSREYERNKPIEYTDKIDSSIKLIISYQPMAPGSPMNSHKPSCNL